jgi:hypothetical protein
MATTVHLLLATTMMSSFWRNINWSTLSMASKPKNSLLTRRAFPATEPAHTGHFWQVPNRMTRLWQCQNQILMNTAVESLPMPSLPSLLTNFAFTPETSARMMSEDEDDLIKLAYHFVSFQPLTLALNYLPFVTVHLLSRGGSASCKRSSFSKS